MPEPVSQPCWTLNGTEAHLNAAVQLAIDLRRPQAGLHSLVCDTTTLDKFRVLGLLAPDMDRDAQQSLIDGYVRALDLIATYAQTEDRTAQVQYDWRWLPEETFGGIEVLLSVQTSLLESRPGLQTQSLFGHATVGCLTTTMDFQSIGHSTMVRDDRGTGVFLIRPQDHPTLSYVEMIHPSDFVQADLRFGCDGVELLYQLFPDSLEKGVIRRARIQAFWLPRSGDEKLACERYNQLVSSAPRLTA